MMVLMWIQFSVIWCFHHLELKISFLICSHGRRNEKFERASSFRTYNSAPNSCPSVLLLLRDLKNVPLSIKELVDHLNKDEADLILVLVKSSVLDQALEWSSSELKLDLHGMHLNSAYLIMLQWFYELKLRYAGNYGTPSEILVVCGSEKHSSTRGEYPVNRLVKEIMIRMKCLLRISRRTLGVS